MELVQLRRRLALTQSQLAALMGVSQAAVSQYEGGHRTPAGHALGFYDRLRKAADADVIVEPDRRRSTTMPAHRWVRVIDPAYVSTFDLPVRLDWSPRRALRWHYDDEAHRRELYRIVLDVGDALDVMTYVDVDELAAWSNELLVSSDTRGMLDRLVERTTATAGV